MTKYHLVLLIPFCLIYATSCKPAVLPANADSVAVIQMLKEGFQIARGQDATMSDSEEYGGALILTALERFAQHPEIATEVKAIFASHIIDDNPMIRYTQWGILQGYLDDSLNLCNNATVFHTAWNVRREIVGERQKAVVEAVSELLPTLISFLEEVKKIESVGEQFLSDFRSIKQLDEKTRACLYYFSRVCLRMQWR